MRFRTTVTVLGVGLALASLVACSSGSKAANSTTSNKGGASAASGSGSTSSPAGSTVGGTKTKTLNVCSLLSATQASSLVGKTYTSQVAKTLAEGQDQCTYRTTDGLGFLVITVFQPTSGYTWEVLTALLGGKPTPVSGVGDRAEVGPNGLGVQVGPLFLSVDGAGGTLSGDYAKAVTVAKTVIAKLT